MVGGGGGIIRYQGQTGSHLPGLSKLVVTHAMGLLSENMVPRKEEVLLSHPLSTVCAFHRSWDPTDDCMVHSVQPQVVGGEGGGIINICFCGFFI